MDFTKYNPKDLYDCFSILRTELSIEDLYYIRNNQEDWYVGSHLNFGMKLRNELGLWKNSDLAKWFNKEGIFHPDDMSGIICLSFSRWFNGFDIKLEEQIKKYQIYWNNQEGVNND